MLYDVIELVDTNTMSSNNHTAKPNNGAKVTIHLCVPDDQQKHLPKRRRAPAYLPSNVPLPRREEVVYLSSSSAWVVVMVVHEWQSAHELRVEIWLEHVSAARHARPTGFHLTQ